MASSFSTDLKLELMVTGENSGTWGDKTNTNLNLLQQAIAGYQSIALTSTNTTLAMTDATISNARNAVIEFTGTIAANSTVYVASGIEKTYTIKNSTTGAFTLALNQVGGSSVIWGTTEKNIKGVYLNGTNANTIDLSTLGGAISTSASIGDFVIGPNELDTASVTEFKIASSAVTSTKIASFAVTSGALDTASVTSVKIASGAVGATQLANTSVTAGSYTTASITVDAQGRLTAASSGVAGGGLGGITAYITAGTQTFTIPSGKTVIKATIIGGGGGTASITASECTSSGSAGAGAGGTAIKYLTVTPGNTIAVTIGAAGSTAGGTGGTSSIASGTQTITTVSATGGVGAGGEGGLGSNGDLNIKGGGGTSAYNGGNPTFGIAGIGGNSFFGGTTKPGAAGTLGSGAGGNSKSGAGPAAPGILGGAGVVVFEY